MEISLSKALKPKQTGKLKYYLMLILVVFIWGAVSPIRKLLYNDFSPAMYTAIQAVIAFFAILIICCTQLKNLNKEYFKIALITGMFYSVAVILQNEGANYTTPAMNSFLENLSCLIVPFLVWILTRNRPAIFKFIGAILCLVSLFILCFRGGVDDFQFGIGEIMSGLAGLLYGVNIAVTGIKARKLNARLYLLVQFGVHALISTYYALVSTIVEMFNNPKFTITLNATSLLILIAIVLVSTVLGWLIRTICLTNLPPSFVAIVMPFSSIISVAISVIIGQEKFTSGLIIGAIVGIVAAIVSDLDIDRIKRKRRYLQYKREKEEKDLKSANSAPPPTIDENSTPPSQN